MQEKKIFINVHTIQHIPGFNLSFDQIDSITAPYGGVMRGFIDENLQIEGIRKEFQNLVKLEDGEENVPEILFGNGSATDDVMNSDCVVHVEKSYSTHEVHWKDDFRDDTGWFIGTVSKRLFFSECGEGGGIEWRTQYRYASTNITQLAKNFDHDDIVLLVRALIESIVYSNPLQLRFHNCTYSPPSMVYISIQQGFPLNLSEAFLNPVIPNQKDGLTDLSIKQFIDFAKASYQKEGVRPDLSLIFHDVYDGIETERFAESMNFPELLKKVAAYIDTIFDLSDSLNLKNASGHLAE